MKLYHVYVFVDDVPKFRANNIPEHDLDTTIQDARKFIETEGGELEVFVHELTRALNHH